jgi:hypothetical protein
MDDKGFKEVSYESLFNMEFVFGIHLSCSLFFFFLTCTNSSLAVVENELDVTKLQRPEIDAIQQVIIHEVRVQEKRNLVSI